MNEKISAGMLTEILQLLDTSRDAVHPALRPLVKSLGEAAVKLFNAWMDSGRLPGHWVKMIAIPLPKKARQRRVCKLPGCQSETGCAKIV